MSETKTERDLMEALLKAGDEYARSTHTRIQMTITPHEDVRATYPKHTVDINNPKLRGEAFQRAAKKMKAMRTGPLGKAWEDLTHEEKKEISLQLSKQPVFGMDIAKLRWEKKPNGHWVNYDYQATAGTFGK